MLPQMTRLLSFAPRVFASGLFVFAIVGLGVLLALIILGTYLLGLGAAALAGRDTMWLETLAIGFVIVFAGYVLTQLSRR